MSSKGVRRLLLPTADIGANVSMTAHDPRETLSVPRGVPPTKLSSGAQFLLSLRHPSETRKLLIVKIGQSVRNESSRQ